MGQSSELVNLIGAMSVVDDGLTSFGRMAAHLPHASVAEHVARMRDQELWGLQSSLVASRLLVVHSVIQSQK